MQETKLTSDMVLAGLKAAGENTRLRILALLQEHDLTVKDFTTVLGQSQPRISRHLKLLAEARLIQRFPEGAWVYYRLTDSGAQARLIRSVLDLLDTSAPEYQRDRERLDIVKREQARQAAAYFATNAPEWDRLRTLHVAEREVEQAIARIVGKDPFDGFLDLGTGTGRLLELFSAQFERGVGVDLSSQMLSIARANLNKAGIRNAQVRQGDIYSLPVTPGTFDVVAIHQVLHYLDDPLRAVAEAARALRPGGRLLVVDFAPHDLEFLREEHAHRRLGFDHAQVEKWLTSVGLVTETVEDLLPPDDGNDHLTVTIWMARDPRMAVANDDVTLDEREAV